MKIADGSIDDDDSNYAKIIGAIADAEIDQAEAFLMQHEGELGSIAFGGYWDNSEFHTDIFVAAAKVAARYIAEMRSRQHADGLSDDVTEDL